VSEIEALERQLRTVSSGLDRRVGEARLLAARGKSVVAEIAEVSAEIESLDKIVAVLNTVGEERQAKAQLTIESLVTRGLQTIFGEDLSFHIVSTTKAKSTVTDFIVRTTLADGSQVDTPILEARGGGLAATIGVLLRIVMILLGGKSESHVLVLDEPFAMVSAEFEIPLANFLRDLVDKSPIQIIMVTHSEAYSEFADSKYRFSIRNGKTQVKAVG
jgi:ABC-type cobalamin/Fe3+-siderophores transport system ATPase subunit